MDAAYPGMMSRSLNETLPPFQRPFLVHELIHGAAGRAKGVPRQPERNADSEQGVRAGEPKILIKRQRYDDGEVQEQIRLIMQMRSEERRVGKEVVRTGRSRGCPDHNKKKQNT